MIYSGQTFLEIIVPLENALQPSPIFGEWQSAYLHKVFTKFPSLVVSIHQLISSIKPSTIASFNLGFMML